MKQTVKTTASQPNSTQTLADATGLTFTVNSGITYYFEFFLLFSMDNAANGLNCGLTFPASTAFSAAAMIPNGADGTSAARYGWITSSGDSVTASTSPSPSGTVFMASLKGEIKPSATGTLQVQFASSDPARTVTLQASSCGTLQMVM